MTGKSLSLFRWYSVQTKVDGVPSVYVSRCPCIHPKDGKRLRVLTERPAGMRPEEWEELQSRPFGEIIFSGKGQAIPETIAAGDLDGDRYFVCWNPLIVTAVRPPQEEDEVAAAFSSEPPTEKASQKTQECDPAAWLARAQAHMLKPETLHEGHKIGKLYNAAEAVADKSDLGIRDPDAQALFKAYAQAIDQGKHGGGVHIPDHLKSRFRL